MHTSYHVHSMWSDGDSPTSDIVRAADLIGLDELGISDHYVLTPDMSQLDWSMPLDSLDEYVSDVQTAAGEAGSSVVRLGIEADFFPETADDLRCVLASQPFDFVIGSVHIVDGFLIDSEAAYWENIDQNERDRIISLYWTRIRQMAGSGLFDIAGHLDLTRKFGYTPSFDVAPLVGKALDAIAEADMAVELNTAGWYLPCAMQYPEERILRGCLEREIPVMINADAHSTANLTRGYDRAVRLLMKIGFRCLARYGGRQRFLLDMPE